MNKNRRFFLIYSIVLFSVAFILILFSSFTGVRYKDAQYKKSKLYQGAQESVLTLTEKNEALEKENEKKSEQLKTMGEEKAKVEADLKKVTEQKEIVVKNMDALAQAQNLYNGKKYTEAAQVLESIDITALSESGKIQYENLRGKLF